MTHPLREVFLAGTRTEGPTLCRLSPLLGVAAARAGARAAGPAAPCSTERDRRSPEQKAAEQGGGEAARWNEAAH